MPVPSANKVTLVNQAGESCFSLQGKISILFCLKDSVALFHIYRRVELLSLTNLSSLWHADEMIMCRCEHLVCVTN